MRIWIHQLVGLAILFPTLIISVDFFYNFFNGFNVFAFFASVLIANIPTMFFLKLVPIKCYNVDCNEKSLYSTDLYLGDAPRNYQCKVCRKEYYLHGDVHLKDSPNN